MLSSLVSFLSCSYGESFPVSAEAVDSSFCLPIGKAKVFIYLFILLKSNATKTTFFTTCWCGKFYWFWHGPTNDTTLLSTIDNLLSQQLWKKLCLQTYCCLFLLLVIIEFSLFCWRWQIEIEGKDVTITAFSKMVGYALKVCHHSRSFGRFIVLDDWNMHYIEFLHAEWMKFIFGYLKIKCIHFFWHWIIGFGWSM